MYILQSWGTTCNMCFFYCTPSSETQELLNRVMQDFGGKTLHQEWESPCALALTEPAPEVFKILSADWPEKCLPSSFWPQELSSCFFMIIIYFLFFSTDLLPPESSCLTISLHACVVPFVVILFCHNIFVNLEYMYSVFCSKSPLPQTPAHTFNLPLTVEGLRKVLFSCPVVTKTYPEQAKFESCLSELQAWIQVLFKTL